PHGRAGEPGYVPRRERMRSGESTFGADIFPAETDWPEREPGEPPLEEDLEDRPTEFSQEDTHLLEGEGLGASEDVRPARRRRRERARPLGPEAVLHEPPDRPPGEAPEPMEDDFTPEPGPDRSFGRGRRPEVESLGEFDDLDLEEIGEFDRPALDDEEFA